MKIKTKKQKKKQIVSASARKMILCMVVYRVFSLQMPCPVRAKNARRPVPNREAPDVERRGEPADEVERPVEEGEGGCEDRGVQEEMLRRLAVLEQPRHEVHEINVQRPNRQRRECAKVEPREWRARKARENDARPELAKGEREEERVFDEPPSDVRRVDGEDTRGGGERPGGGECEEG